jgi:hypothetical protein
MPRFSRGVRPEARRDVRRILDAAPAEQRRAVGQVIRRLFDALAEDPHEKGEPCGQTWNPLLRVLHEGPIRMFYWVRQPPLEDLYVEVTGFSSS